MIFFESEPDGFGAGLAVAFAAEKAAQTPNQVRHLVEPLALRRLTRTIFDFYANHRVQRTAAA